MTDPVGTMAMFADAVVGPATKPPAKRMVRIDVRLPQRISDIIETRADELGLSVSEYTRALLIDALEQRTLL